jgi:hypothetical protein
MQMNTRVRSVAGKTNARHPSGWGLTFHPLANPLKLLGMRSWSDQD